MWTKYVSVGERGKSFPIDLKTLHEESFAVFKMRLKSEYVGFFFICIIKV